MSSHGYTRRDHRHRKRRSRRGNELLLDKLLKVFFYILIALIAIILLKVVFFSDKKENNEDNKNTTKNHQSATVPDVTADSGTGDKTSENANDNSTGESKDSSTEESSDTPTEETTPFIPEGDYRVFDDAAFVGDSRIGGIYLSSQLTTSTFYYDVGGNVSSAVDGHGIELDNGSKGSVIDALRQREFSYVFIEYGVNEWGWVTSGFISGYEKLITEIKAVQPNAKIYVMSIIPVTAKYAEERSDGAMNVNAKLDEMDAEVKKMAERLGVNYVNVVEAVTGGQRVLADDMSSDGYHLNKEENLKLLDYLCNVIK